MDFIVFFLGVFFLGVAAGGVLGYISGFFDGRMNATPPAAPKEGE